MDVRRSWYRIFDPLLKDRSVTEGNLIVHFDGGTRTGKCSAAAWYIESRVVRDGNEYIFPRIMAGSFMDVPVSSFLKEAIGLEESTKYVLELLQ